MSNKFLTLVENSISRYSNGGLLVGDIVKFVKDFKSHECFKTLSTNVQNYITSGIVANGDKHLRVVNIKSQYPTSAPNNNDNRGTSFTVELAYETAPGYPDLQNRFSVPSCLVEPHATYPSQPDIPDSFRKKEKINHQPVEPKEEDEQFVNNPYLQTMMSQDGNKLTRGDRALTNKNTKIPSSPAKGANSPAVPDQDFTPITAKIGFVS